MKFKKQKSSKKKLLKNDEVSQPCSTAFKFVPTLSFRHVSVHMCQQTDLHCPS